MSEKSNVSKPSQSQPKVIATEAEAVSIIANTLLEFNVCREIRLPDDTPQVALADTKDVSLHAQGRVIPADIQEMILRPGSLAEEARQELVQGLRDLVTEAIVKLDATQLVRDYLTKLGQS